MQRIWFFDFESRQWSSRLTSGGRNDWTFGHAIRRSKYMYAYGTHHGAQTEESVAEVGLLSGCSRLPVPCMTLHTADVCLLHDALLVAILVQQQSAVWLCQ